MNGMGKEAAVLEALSRSYTGCGSYRREVNFETINLQPKREGPSAASQESLEELHREKDFGNNTPRSEKMNS